jgi:hypothetical protein
MRTLRLALLLLAVGGAASVRAEETLVVVDNAGTVLGPVVGAGCTATWDCGWRQVTFVYRQGAGYVLLRTASDSMVEDASGLSSTQYVYFQSADCSDTLGVVDPGDCCGGFPIPRVRLAGTELWAVDVTSEACQIVTQSRRRLGSSGPSSVCEPVDIPGLVVAGNCATPWGTIAFTLPLRVALNPAIFADQFQTGDLSRWSNY